MKNKVFDYKEKPFKELLKGQTLWDYQIKKKKSQFYYWNLIYK